jgi:hypothetical protein
MKRFLLPVLLFIFFGNHFSYAQVSIKDSSIATSLIGISYAYQIPGGDLAKRFLSNSAIGGSYLFKTKSNWLFGADGFFMFRDTIKETDIFSSIKTSDGNIIDGNGIFSEYRLQERGFNISSKIGKLFPVWGPNKNSGIVILAGVGLLQHKISIYEQDKTTPQIEGDYKKGYDRLTNGLSIDEFIGYMYLGNSRLVSFFAGFDLTQAWTKGRRGYNFDLRGPDNTKRFDILSGIKIGWILPLYSQAPDKFYYH